MNMAAVGRDGLSTTVEPRQVSSAGFLIGSELIESPEMFQHEMFDQKLSTRFARLAT